MSAPLSVANAVKCGRRIPLDYHWSLPSFYNQFSCRVIQLKLKARLNDCEASEFRTGGKTTREHMQT